VGGVRGMVRGGLEEVIGCVRDRGCRRHDGDDSCYRYDEKCRVDEIIHSRRDG
jgi:hypothetical protein